MAISWTGILKHKGSNHPAFMCTTMVVAVKIHIMTLSRIISIITICIATPLGLSGQDGCGEVRNISTSPDAPVNDFIGEPWLNDGDFDWREVEWDMYIHHPGQVPQPETTISPFYVDQSNVNIEHLVVDLGSVPDNAPEDGWELVHYQNGYQLEGDDITLPDPGKTHPIYVFYNRHRSILRVLIRQHASGFQSDNQRASIVLQHKDNGDYHNAVLSPLGDQVKALDNFDKYMKLHALNRVNSTAAMWLYGDFMVMYDPCVCHYDSQLHILVENVSRSEISLSGTLSTQNYVGVVESAQSTVADEAKPYDDVFSLLGSSDAKDVQKGAQKTYDSAEAFVNSFKQEAKKEPEKKKDEIDKEAKEKGGLDSLLASVFPQLSALVPFGREAIGLYNTVSGLFKPKNPYSVSKGITPIAFEAGLEVNGIMETITIGAETVFETPGSEHDPTNPDLNVPMYHNPLGVFNLLKTPVLERYLYKSGTPRGIYPHMSHS